MVTDPVCLMELDPSEAKAAAEFEGRTYYFCSTDCREKFLEQPRIYLDKAPGIRMTVGVMGSAGSEQTPQASDIAFRLGQAIAKRNFFLITGACPGLPYDCAHGARKQGGLSVGISPALSLDEHVHKYHSPSDSFDVIIYTGSGLMGREVTNIRSSDMVIILGGRSGTLGEFAIAYDEGKLIGVMKGSGGITDTIPEIVASFGGKATGARLVYDDDPGRLIERMAEVYTAEHYKWPSCFCHESLAAR